MASVWGELRRRNVFRIAVAYAIVAWLLIEMSATVFPALKLPEWTVTFVTVFILISFPIILIGAWAFEVTPDGLKRTREVPLEHSITRITGRKFDFAIIGLLATAIVFLVVDNYVLRDEPAPVASEQTGRASQPVARSIAVLPFVNMSSDPEQEFFSDGLSEEILNLLAKIPALKVIARTSSFSFKGQNEDVRNIGEALGVNTVLEGSVRKSGHEIRITAQLIDVSDGAHIWSETYNRTLNDIFAVQDDVAAAIIDALKIHVGANPTRGRPTENAEAYSLFLKARAAMNLADAYHAVELSLKAIELDPQFAEAHELLAYGYWLQAGYTMDAKSSQKAMFDAASRALTINPGLYFARALQGAGQLSKDAFLREIQGLERVLIEEPTHAAAAAALTYDLLFAGYFEEGSTIAERYVALDPLSAKTQFRRSQALSATGRERESLESLKLAGQLGVETTNLDLALVQLFEKRDEHAVVEYEAALQAQDLPTGWLHRCSLRR